MSASYYTNLHEGLGIIIFGALAIGGMILNFWLGVRHGRDK